MVYVTVLSALFYNMGPALVWLELMKALVLQSSDSYVLVVIREN